MEMYERFYRRALEVGQTVFDLLAADLEREPTPDEIEFCLVSIGQSFPGGGFAFYAGEPDPTEEQIAKYSNLARSAIIKHRNTPVFPGATNFYKASWGLIPGGDGSPMRTCLDILREYAKDENWTDPGEQYTLGNVRWTGDGEGPDLARKALKDIGVESEEEKPNV